MDERPDISVVMSVYNSENYLQEAVESILSQSFKNFEFLIIDDGSTDSSTKILHSFSDSRIKVISQTNTGLTRALNKGLREAKGTYIARMDADDKSKPKRLERQLAFLKANPQLAGCGTWAKTINAQGEETGEYRTPTEHRDIRKIFLLHNPFIHPSMMFRKTLIESIGYYNEKIQYAQDYEYWSRVLKRFPMENIAEYLLQYRVLPESMTRKNTTKMRWEGIKVRLSHLIGFTL